MFDISWSEMLILAVVALIFVGPKDLPVFLRVLGRYTGMVKRQAAEFRAQFDAAMREAERAAEVEALQKSVADAGRQASGAVREAVSGLPAEKDFATPPPASNENSPIGAASATPFPAKSET